MPYSSSNVGPPKLIDFSCRIREPDSGTAACILSLELEKKITSTLDKKPSPPKIDLELNPSTLSTLLDGVGHIRDQLSTVANKK